jgi:thymidylate kinase
LDVLQGEKYSMDKDSNLNQDYYSVSIEDLFPSNNSLKIIYIEGAGGSGKSTTFKILRHRGFHTIGQYGAYLNPAEGEGFPPLTNSHDEIIKSDIFWLTLEARRISDIHKNSQPHEPLLVERSYLSRFGFEFAKRKQNMCTSVLHLAGNYSSLLELGLLPYPYGYILLTAKPEELNRRIISRKQFTPKFLSKVESLNWIDYFYKKFLSLYVDPEKYTIIDTTNIEPEKVADLVEKFTCKFVASSYPDYGIWKFLSDLFCNSDHLSNF